MDQLQTEQTLGSSGNSSWEASGAHGWTHCRGSCDAPEAAQAAGPPSVTTTSNIELSTPPPLSWGQKASCTKYGWPSTASIFVTLLTGAILL